MSRDALNTSIWDRNETLSCGDLQALQLERLKAVVARVAHVPFYRKAFSASGITADSIGSLDDLRRMPFTTKEDLRQHYPLGFLAVAREEVARFMGPRARRANRRS